MQAAAAVSYLFVPGNRPERFDKAYAAGADVVIIDLEDAVPPSEKEAARAAIAAWCDVSKPIALRINSADSIWFSSDLELCEHAGVTAVILPKAAHLSEIAQVMQAGAKKVLPLIESGIGLAHAFTLAAAQGVERLMFGSIDFSVDMGIEGDDRELDYFRSQLVLASRLAGIAAPIDGVTTAIDDTDVLYAETLRSKRFGFGGKLCIHPKQLATVHAAFSPTPDEISWAHRVLDAAIAADGAAIAVDGKMVDKPVIIKAQRIAQQAERTR